MDKELFKNKLEAILLLAEEVNEKIDNLKKESFDLSGMCNAFNIRNPLNTDSLLNVANARDIYKTIMAAYEYLDRINFNFNGGCLKEDSIIKFRVISYGSKYAAEMLSRYYDYKIDLFTGGLDGFNTLEEAKDFLFKKVVEDIIANNGKSKILPEDFRNIKKFIKL